MGIHRFVWEHFQNVNWIAQCTRYCGATFSGFKTLLCVPELTIIAHHCTYEGRIPNPTNLDKVLN